MHALVRGRIPYLPVHADDIATATAGISVLVVDDDEASREVIAAQLRRAQATVLTASSAARGFEVLRDQGVDVLLADIGMPGEDGYSFIRRVRAALPALTKYGRGLRRQCNEL